MALVQITDLVKRYPGGKLALDHLTLEIHRGEFLVVIGLSGSGKSTLLRCLNRLIEPTSGTIRFDGQDVTAARPGELRNIRRQIGMIFQHFNLVERRTVIENVLNGTLGYDRHPLRLLGWFPKESRERALASLERVGLQEYAFQRADALSGGQMQRVGIARALMQQPQLMLADEPVASLDPATSDSVMGHLKELNENDGMTIVTSLHFLSLARRYATRVIALRDGVVCYDGPALDIDEARFKSIYGEDAIEVTTR